MKDEIPVPPYQIGNLESAEIELNSDYRYQIYFDLETNKNVGQNLKTEWDLGFECSADGWHIKLNSANRMLCARTNSTDFKQITDTNGNYQWKWDAETGNLDSTAIGNWRTHGMIYILSRGFDEKGKYLGDIKVRFIQLNNGEYQFEYCAMKDTIPLLQKVSKVSSINFVSFSFSNGGAVKILEPNKGSWDLLFTQYTTYFEEEKLTYLVTGALLNPYMTFSALDTLETFSKIDLEFSLALDFKNVINNPGYKWKWFDFDAQQYVVNSSNSYVFLTSEGSYYKLRFTDFVDATGARGTPKFEFQRL